MEGRREEETGTSLSSSASSADWKVYPNRILLQPELFWLSKKISVGLEYEFFSKLNTSFFKFNKHICFFHYWSGYNINIKITTCAEQCKRPLDNPPPYPLTLSLPYRHYRSLLPPTPFPSLPPPVPTHSHHKINPDYRSELVLRITSLLCYSIIVDENDPIYQWKRNDINDSKNGFGK